MNEERKLEQAARELRNAYNRAWRARNREKVSEINRRYWARMAQRKLEAEAHNKEA